MKNNTLIILGATATGKSNLGLQIALEHEGIILNADKQQMYKGLPILTNCPSHEERKKVKHLNYEFLEPGKEFTAHDWVELTEKSQQKNCLNIIVGGSMFYIHGLICGMPNFQTNIKLEEDRYEDLYWQYKDKIDSKIHFNDKYRVLRSIEVFLNTGKTMQWWQQNNQKSKKRKFYCIDTSKEKEKIIFNIQTRIEKMIHEGLQEEVKRFLKTEQTTNAIGFAECKDFIEGKIDLQTMKKKILHTTWQYAKKQIMWTKKIQKLPNVTFCKKEFVKELTKGCVAQW